MAIGYLVVLGVVTLLGSSAMQADERTYAERLGWPAGTKAIIFHVDDAGMSYDSNRGAMKAIEEGVATSLSIMMPCPWVPQCAAWLRENPQVDAGLHLTLTSEWKNYRWGPVAGKPAVPGLVDEEGCLWHSVSGVVTHASADEVETEMRAQVDKALAMGIRPTHLDSHMGTCFQPFYIERYVKLGVEKNIAVMMVGGHMQHIGAEAAQFKPMLRSLAQRLWDAGLPVLDDLVTQPTRAKDYNDRKKELMALLRDMKPGVTQVIVHCTDPTEVFPHISGSGPARLAELRLMTDPDIEAFIKDEGIVLTTWRELKQRRTEQ
jgi:predicted glycoside hydrolase/deacetylase ChbG (UPF0249 family)